MAKQFSKFKVTSFGGGGGLKKAADRRALIISILTAEIEALETKMAELYARPPMDFTDQADPGFKLFWDPPTDKAPFRPRWSPLGVDPTSSDTYEEITSTFSTTGTEKNRTRKERPIPIRQPWILQTSTSLAFVSSGVDVSTNSLTGFPTTVPKSTNTAIGEARRGRVFHWETSTWVSTGTFEQTDWPDGFSPGTHTTTSAITAPVSTRDTTFRFTPGSPTTPTTSP